MGLLDFMNTPEGQGLLSAAFGGMASARRGAPINSIGRAGLAGLQGYSGAIDQQNQRTEQEAQTKYRNMQISQAEQAAKTAEAQRAAQQIALSSMSPEIQKAVSAGVPFSEIWKRKNPEDMYKVVGGSMVKVSGGDVQPVFTAPEKPQDLPWYVRRGQNGALTIDPAYADLERTKASFGRPPAQPMQPVAYVDDKGNTVWGTITEAKGRQAANFSPTVQGAITNAKEQGKVTGQSTATAQVELPSAVAQAEQAIKLSDELVKHPGFGAAVGLSSAIDPRNYINGTDAKDFQIRLDQIKGQQFMQAYQGLKGGGQITEVEGKKATDAISRMNTASSEPEFRKAVDDFQTVIKQGLSRAKAKASVQTTSESTTKPVRRYNPQTGRIE